MSVNNICDVEDFDMFFYNSTMVRKQFNKKAFVKMLQRIGLVDSVFETEIVEDIELDKKLKEELAELDNLVRAKRREIENVKFR